jgi:T-complex protein 1 subunit alpha
MLVASSCHKFILTNIILVLGGQKISGADVREQNGMSATALIWPANYEIPTSLVVLATQAIANVVKSSFGPSGLDKMMVDDIGVCAIYFAIVQ